MTRSGSHRFKTWKHMEAEDRLLDSRPDYSEFIGRKPERRHLKAASVRQGDRFGHLVVMHRQGPNWRCRCDCGRHVETTGMALTRGRMKSCGDYCELPTPSRIRYQPEYSVWRGMVTRCYYPTARGWKNYGGRGIRICRRWYESFEAFYADMGPRPSPKHTIERIDNNGHYGPGNCRWATHLDQMRNTCRNVWILVNGKPMVVSEACEKLGISRSEAVRKYEKIDIDIVKLLTRHG